MGRRHKKKLNWLTPVVNHNGTLATYLTKDASGMDTVCSNYVYPGICVLHREMEDDLS